MQMGALFNEHLSLAQFICPYLNVHCLLSVTGNIFCVVYQCNTAGISTDAPSNKLTGEILCFPAAKSRPNYLRKVGLFLPEHTTQHSKKKSPSTM
jgi:hypothetical protein